MVRCSCLVVVRFSCHVVVRFSCLVEVRFSCIDLVKLFFCVKIYSYGMDSFLLSW